MRPLLAVAGLFVLAGDYFVDSSPLGVVLAAVAWLGLTSDPTPNDDTVGFVGAAVAGAFGAATWVVAPSAWVLIVASVLARAALTSLPRREIALLSAAFVVPLSLFIATLVPALSDAHRALVQALGSALPDLSVLALRVALVVACLWVRFHAGGERDPADAPRPLTTLHRWSRAATLALVLTAAAWALVFRGRTVFAFVRSPSDTLQWSESPLLMNVQKLRLGLPIYGPLEDVSSYTYSPTIEAIHRVLLAPFHLELRIVAHRVLVLGWQASTVLVLSVALWPRLPGRARLSKLAAGAAVIASFVALLWWSPASPFLHPDHGLNFCVALAVALLVMQPRLPPFAFRAGIVLLPAFATMFKLTGAGVGVGLALALLGRHRERGAIQLILVSALVALSTIPLFDALFGPFSDYAIRLMASHPLNLERLPQSLLTAPGRLTLLGIGLAFACRREPRSKDDTARLAFLSLGIWSTTVIAFLKEGGRANNLVAAAIPAVAALVIVAGTLGDRSTRRDDTQSGLPALVAFVALVILVARQTAPFDAELLLRALDDQRFGVAFVQRELREGRHPLVLGSALTWIDAGGFGVPKDELHPAVELFLAKSPVFQAHLARIASGTYTSIVAPAVTFVVTASHGVPFGALYRDAVRERYCVVHPVDRAGASVPLTYGEGSLFLRRKDLGCAPIATH